jgi:O-antigen/teichoic acid export membrane protein
MTSDFENGTSAEPAVQSLGGRARSGTAWIVLAFGLGQVLRLGANVVLAALLFEEAFALMAIVSAVMMGLAMFSDIGLQTNVVQHPRGDEPDFLNTAWTLQVIRGICLFSVALILAWPLAQIYGANDPKAYELLYLIPIVALTSLIDGFKSAKLMTAARHLNIKEVIQIDFVAGIFNALVIVALAWYLRSVYALAIAAVLSTTLSAFLSYWMLKGPRSGFRWEAESIRAIISFGKWIFISTVITFLALQIDRLALAGTFPLAEVGVYAIAASLAAIIPALVGKVQGSVLFAWYSRMLQQGMPLPVAFARTHMAALVLSSYLCALLVSGASSFFALAYDDRYSMGGVLLPMLAIGAWFSCLETMYGAAFIASGRSKWVAITSAIKVGSYALMLIPLFLFKLDIATAAMFFAASEVVRIFCCQYLGRTLGLKNARVEGGMLTFFLLVSLTGWWMAAHAPFVSEIKPFWRLAVLGLFTTGLFLPLFLRFVIPLIRPR